jgi:ankyrin repeat protein
MTQPDVLPDDHPFFSACEVGDLSALEKFFASGIKVTTEGQTRPPAIVSAMALRNIDFIKLLLKYGLDINEQRGPFQLSVLLGVVKNEDDQLIRFALEHGADVNLADKYGISPYMIAASKGNLRIIKLLEERGANIHAKTTQGLNAVMFAAEQGHFEVLEHLLSKGLSIDPRHSCGDTPLICAAKNGKEKTVEWLLNHRADINAEDGRGRTALDWAKKKGHQGIVDLLQRRLGS